MARHRQPYAEKEGTEWLRQIAQEPVLPAPSPCDHFHAKAYELSKNYRSKTLEQGAGGIVSYLPLRRLTVGGAVAETQLSWTDSVTEPSPGPAFPSDSLTAQ